MMCGSVKILATAIASMGIAAVGCGNGNPAGTSSEGGANHSATKEAAEGVIRDCFNNHAYAHRFQGATHYISVNGLAEDYDTHTNVIARGCAAIKNDPQCETKLKSYMFQDHQTCINSSLSSVVNDNQKISYGFNFDLNGAVQTNVRSKVDVSTANGKHLEFTPIP